MLSISGLKGNPGNDGTTPADGKDSVMQKITVGGQTYSSDSLNEVVFTGSVASLENGVLTLNSLQGTRGDDGLNAVMQTITVGSETFHTDSLTSVVSKVSYQS